MNEGNYCLALSGKVLDDTDRFDINFLSGCQHFDEHQGCVAFHINFRFNEKKIVLNSFMVIL